MEVGGLTYTLLACSLNDSVSSVVMPRRRMRLDAAKFDCARRIVRPLASASADDNGFSLIRVHRQTVDVEPVLYCAKTVGKRRHWLHVLQRDVQVHVVGVLRLFDLE
jgi:hypothetical protein